MTLGFSPCPNDTFMLHAMLHGLVDTEGISFEPHIADVQELNELAINNTLDITKISYLSYLQLLPHYHMLTSGSALGFGVGPLLISKNEITAQAFLENSNLKIALPGKNTTAHFLFSYFAENHKNKEFIIFSDIEKEILEDKIDAGVIIHENRFTYHNRGLNKIVDLGTFWEQHTHLPIPLGGIAVKRNTDEALKKKINRIIHRSVAYAFSHPDASRVYVHAHAQEMEQEVQQQHIALYVNDFSLDQGPKGTAAVHKMQTIANKIFDIKPSDLPLFV